MDKKKKHYVKPETIVLGMDGDNDFLLGLSTSPKFSTVATLATDFAKEAIWMDWDEEVEKAKVDW